MADTNVLRNKADRDRINRALRGSRLWRDAITRLGHDPDRPLRLNKDEQRSLAATLQLPAEDFHIDPAGNINDYHGWKGLPTWAKVAIGAGVTAASLGLVPGVPGLPGVSLGGGGGATGTAAGGTTAVGGEAAVAGTVGGEVLRRGASRLGNVGRDLALTGIGAGIDLFNSLAQARAQGRITEEEFRQRTAELEYARERDAARLGLDREQLAYARERDAAQLAFDRERWGGELAQAMAALEVQQNQWADRYGLEKAQYETTEGGRLPYRSAGVGAVTALARGTGSGMAPVSMSQAPAPSPRVTINVPRPTLGEVSAGARPPSGGLPPPSDEARPRPEPGPAGTETPPQDWRNPGGPAGVRGGAVTMVGPDGSTREVPEGDVDYWRRKGAQVA